MAGLPVYCTLILLLNSGVNVAQEGKSTATGPCDAVAPPCDVVRNYGHPTNCSLFWECSDGPELLLKECPFGTKFDSLTRTCRREATCTSCSAGTMGIPEGEKPPDPEDVDNAGMRSSDGPEAEPESSGVGEAEDTNPKLQPAPPPSSDKNTPKTGPDSVPLEADVTDVPEAEPEPEMTPTSGIDTETQPEEPTPSTGDIHLGPKGPDHHGNHTTNATSTTTTTAEVPPQPSKPPATSTTGKTSSVDVLIPDKPRSDPPYVLVPEVGGTTSAGANKSDDGVAVKTGGLDKMVIIILVAVGVAVVLIVVAIVVLVLVCRRCRRRQKHEIQIIENPRYRNATPSGEDRINYRFSRDASLYLDHPLNHRIANNNSDEKVNLNSQRTKRRAPPPPNPFTGSLNGFPLRQDSIEYFEKLAKKKKRRAPPPPNPFTGLVDAYDSAEPNSVQFYEKDTPTGSEVELTTFGSPRHASNSPAGGSAAVEVEREGGAEDRRPSYSTEYSDSDEDRLDDTMDNDPEGQTLLNANEGNIDSRLSTNNRTSIADKYRFSDDEDSRVFGRGSPPARYRDSDEDIEEPRSPPYELGDIKDELQTPEFSEEDEEGDERTVNPFLPK